MDAKTIKTGNYYVIALKGGKVCYIRHNGSFTDNILLSKKFDTMQEAQYYAESQNKALGADSPADDRLYAVEQTLNTVEVENG